MCYKETEESINSKLNSKVSSLHWNTAEQNFLLTKNCVSYKLFTFLNFFLTIPLKFIFWLYLYFDKIYDYLIVVQWINRSYMKYLYWLANLFLKFDKSSAELGDIGTSAIIFLHIIHSYTDNTLICSDFTKGAASSYDSETYAKTGDKE